MHPKKMILRQAGADEFGLVIVATFLQAEQDRSECLNSMLIREKSSIAQS